VTAMFLTEVNRCAPPKVPLLDEDYFEGESSDNDSSFEYEIGSLTVGLFSMSFQILSL